MYHLWIVRCSAYTRREYFVAIMSSNVDRRYMEDLLYMHFMLSVFSLLVCLFIDLLCVACQDNFHTRV